MDGTFTCTSCSREQCIHIFLQSIQLHRYQVIALFESSPHPLGSDDRLISSLRMLDAIIRTLGLLYADVEIDGASVFPEGIAPILLPSNTEDTVKSEEVYPVSCTCKSFLD